MGGVAVRDSDTGRILTTRRQTFQELWPTGRKHCSCCGRWRHLIDFSPRKCRGQIYPQSVCQHCAARAQRLRRLQGVLEQTAPNRARAVVAYLSADAPPRQRYNRARRLETRRQWWARWIATIKADPELHQEYLETMRLRQWEQRRAEGRTERPRRQAALISDLVNPTLFLAWKSWQEDLYVTDYERKAIKAYKDGRVEGLAVGLIDRIMTRVGAMDQFAIFDDAGWPAPDGDSLAA